MTNDKERNNFVGDEGSAPMDQLENAPPLRPIEPVEEASVFQQVMMSMITHHTRETELWWNRYAQAVNFMQQRRTRISHGSQTASTLVANTGTESDGPTVAGMLEMAMENATLKKELEMSKQQILVLQKHLGVGSGSIPGPSGATNPTTEPGDKTQTHSTGSSKAIIESIGNGSPGTEGTTTQVVPPSMPSPQPTASTPPMSMALKGTVAMPTTAVTPHPPLHVLAPLRIQGQMTGSSTITVAVSPSPAANNSQAQVSTLTLHQSAETSHQPPPITINLFYDHIPEMCDALVQSTQAAPQGLAERSGSELTSGTEPGTSCTEPTPSGSNAQQEPPVASNCCTLKWANRTRRNTNPSLAVRKITQRKSSKNSRMSSRLRRKKSGAVVGQVQPNSSTPCSVRRQFSKRSGEAPPCNKSTIKRRRFVPQYSKIRIDREAEARCQGHRCRETETEDDGPHVVLKKTDVVGKYCNLQ